MADHPIRPTIKTLSEMTGFSIATISKALNDSPVVTQATKAAIRQAAGQIGYAASLRGMSLRTGRTYQMAVLMPVAAPSGFEWDGVDYAQILSGIAAGLEGSPYRMSVHVVRDADEGLATARQVVEGHLADGLIFSGIQAQDPRVEYLCAAGFPFVTLGRCRQDLTYAHVDVDSDWAAWAATARLIAGGHRRIALINPDPRLSYALDRIDGFTRAFVDAGLPVPQDLIMAGDLSTRFGKQAAITLARLPDPATGFVCVNESTALGALAGLRDLGVDIGRAASVIAYDDINASAYFAPPLTTFYLPIEDLGRQLGGFLLRRLAGEDPATLQQLTRPDLVARQSDRLERVSPWEGTT